MDDQQDESTRRYVEDQLDDLLAKTPEQMAGDPLEYLYYSYKTGEALRANQPDQACEFVERMLTCDPGNSFSRLIAAKVYGQFGNDSEAIAQLGIGLGMDPSNFAV